MTPPYSIEQWTRLFIFPQQEEQRIPVIEDDQLGVYIVGPNHRLILKYGTCECIGPIITNGKELPWVCIQISASEEIVTLYINAIRCAEIANGEATFTLPEFTAPLSKRKGSQIIEANFEVFKQKRKELFLTNTTSRPGRIGLDLHDQIEQLRNRATALRRFISNLESGDPTHRDDITGSLRSLLYFELKRNSTTKINPSYNPLLLRTAAILEQPLPVYRNYSDCSFRTLIEERIVKGSLWAFDIMPAIKPTNVAYIQQDFQEFLETDFLVYDGNYYTPLDLIQSTANTESTAHFDPEAIPYIRGLKASPEFYGSSVFNHTIVSIAKSTCHFAERLVEASMQLNH